MAVQLCSPELMSENCMLAATLSLRWSAGRGLSARRGVRGQCKAEFLLKPPSGRVGSPSSIDNRVTMCSLYPGFDFVGLQQLVDAHDYKVVVLQLYGSLSAPTGTEIMDCATFVGWCQDAT